MIFYGLSGGTAVLASQYWGKGDTRTIEKVMGIALRLTLLISLVFAAAAWFAPEMLMRIFTADRDLIDAGAQYLRAVGVAYVLNGFCTIYLCTIRCVERVVMSAVVHSVAVLLNIALNACFIFGIGFFPKLGITGVALATSITRAVEALICIIDSAFSRTIKIRIKDLFTHYTVLARDFLKYALPAMGNDMVWGMAFTMYSVILGHLSSDVVAANSMTSTVRNLAAIICFGCSSSGAIILGKAMGDNRLDDAKRYAGRLVRLSIYTAIFAGLVVLALRPALISLTDSGYFKLSAEAKSYFSTMLLITSYYILGQSLNTMLICGVYRAGGDVKFGLIMDACTMWGYAVPVGFLCAFVLKIPPMWVYFILCLDEFVKMPIIIRHYFKYGWLKNITREET
jgi:putative MATE family efflux protein